MLMLLSPLVSFFFNVFVFVFFLFQATSFNERNLQVLQQQHLLHCNFSVVTSKINFD